LTTGFICLRERHVSTLRKVILKLTTILKTHPEVHNAQIHFDDT